MEEVLASSPPPAPTKKRQRKAATGVKGPGVSFVHDRFVCAYSGVLRDKAVVIPDVSNAVFANIPCAVAWLEDNVKDENKRTALLAGLATKYEQVLDNMPRAPPHQQLDNFGGPDDYVHWIGDLSFWDQLTADGGIGVAEYKAQQPKKPPRTKSNTSKKVDSVAFDKGVAQLAHNKSATGGVTQLTTPEEVAAAYAKVSHFCTQQNKDADVTSDAFPLFIIAHYCVQRGIVIGCAARGEGHGDKHLNNVASQVAGTAVYGPALLIAISKFTQKL